MLTSFVNKFDVLHDEEYVSYKVYNLIYSLQLLAQLPNRELMQSKIFQNLLITINYPILRKRNDNGVCILYLIGDSFKLIQIKYKLTIKNLIIDV